MVSVRTAVLAFLLGLVVGGVAVGATLPQEPQLDPSNPPYGVSTATGCIDEPGGWAFTMPADRGQTAVVNLTVAHGPAESVETSLDARAGGRYRFEVVRVQTEKSGTPDCRTGSTVEFGGTLPADFESLTVVYDGTVVGTVRPSDGPAYHPLSV